MDISIEEDEIKKLPQSADALQGLGVSLILIIFGAMKAVFDLKIRLQAPFRSSPDRR